LVILGPRLTFTIMGCIAKVGCLALVEGIVVAIISVLVYIQQVPMSLGLRVWFEEG